MKNVKNKKIAFLDRDGVINKGAAEHEHITHPDDFIFNPGIFELLTTLQNDGYEFIVVTNQRCIATGKLSTQTLKKIHQKMMIGLQAHNISLLDILYCPHNDDECDCRKPNDGMLHAALKKYAIDIAQSLIIGDSQTDIEAGKKFGLGQTILIIKDLPLDALKQYQKPKINIAFIRYGGMSAGGTEKFLQIIAANLDKSRYIVDFYYCDSTPFKGSGYEYPKTDINRLQYAQERGVNLIKFNVEYVDDVHPFHIWKNTDFWQKFDESKYDLIQIGRPGHKEYPFTQIKNTPIIDSIHLKAGADNQFNISRTLHICKYSAQRWIKSGGDSSRVEIVSLPVDIEAKNYGDFRNELNLNNHFIYGMHQRPSDDIFSDIPLTAYKLIESETTAYIMLGGSELYKKQAAELKIKNIFFLPANGNSDTIFKFLSTLNVYAHGRKDGEVNSQAMAEAMYFGSPIVSHISMVNNGHVECIGNAGEVLSSIYEYADELRKLQTNPSYYNEKSTNARARFKQNYELKKQIKRFEEIYESVIKNPYPNPVRRMLSTLHWTQNIRIILKRFYRYIRYILKKNKIV